MILKRVVSLIALATAVSLSQAQEKQLLEVDLPDTVLQKGQSYEVTWDSVPSDLVEGTGNIYFRKDGIVHTPAAATGFNLITGTVQVPVPADIDSGNDYVLLVECLADNKFVGNGYSELFSVE